VTDLDANRPLVVGYPRTGFTLLISVIAELTGPRADPRTRTLKVLCDIAGEQISRRIESVFKRRGLINDLIYNQNFRQLAGGPKWLSSTNPNVACFRKYIGIRGDGDLTLITSHPREILDYYEIIHSHVSPRTWSTQFSTPAGLRFASIRNPAGTLTSACFSLNALASEYIQRFIPPEQDNDLLRQRLALYKLTDLKFFEALLPPFKSYLEEFSEQEDAYHLMRWEDLILRPVETILQIAKSLNLDVTAEQARGVWEKLDHVNLTGAHLHNLRRGHGIAEGWRAWLTNKHLDILRDYGLEQFSRRYGYGAFPHLDERAYTPFQAKVASFLARGEVFRDYGDPDLFGFAFNKSNIDFSRFSFRQYPWRAHTCIERSSCRNESLVMEVSDVAEEACGHFNAVANAWVTNVKNGHCDRDLAEKLCDPAALLFEDTADLMRFRSAIERECDPRLASVNDAPGPILLDSYGRTNIIQFKGKYYALPQSVGAVDFERQDLSTINFLLISESLSDLTSALKKSLD